MYNFVLLLDLRLNFYVRPKSEYVTPITCVKQVS
jgi:hypothetical protein